MLCKIEIKNYRCFSDEAPVEFELHEEFSAIVGPNNSGKSSLLRIFYELRNLWSALHTAQGIAQLLKASSSNLPGIFGVDDPSEIFNDANDRPLTLTFTFPA